MCAALLRIYLAISVDNKVTSSLLLHGLIPSRATDCEKYQATTARITHLQSIGLQANRGCGLVLWPGARTSFPRVLRTPLRLTWTQCWPWVEARWETGPSVRCCWGYRFVCMPMSVTNCMSSEMQMFVASIRAQRAVHPSSAQSLSYCQQGLQHR